MLPQFGSGLLGLGNGGVVNCFKGHIQGCHKFLRYEHRRRVIWAFGSKGLSRLQFGGGQFSSTNEHEEPRGSLGFRKSAGGRGEDEDKQQQQLRNSHTVWSNLKHVSGGDGDEKQLPGKRSVHFIGIGGAGLSALAFLALEQGWQVSGSDATANDIMKALKDAGATVYVGHAPNHVIDPKGLGLPDAIVVSSAIPRNNEELEAAQKASIPIYKRADWLGKITEGYDVLAVAGSHGKSTTAAMLATILHRLGEDVTAIVGAEVPQVIAGTSKSRTMGRRGH